MKRWRGMFAVIGVVGMLSGCGVQLAAPNATMNKVATTSNAVSQVTSADNVSGAGLLEGPKAFNLKQTNAKLAAEKAAQANATSKTKKTTQKEIATHAVTTTKSSQDTTLSSKTVTTSKTTTSPTSTKSSATTTSTTTNTSSESTSTSAPASNPTPAPSDVVTQYVTLPFTGTYPSGCQTAKMTYNKSTGVMEGYFYGLADTANISWGIESGAGTLYYSNDGGGSWLEGQKGTYTSLPGLQGISYTPDLVIRAETTALYAGLAPSNSSGKVNGQFKITYNSGSFSVTSQ